MRYNGLHLRIGSHTRNINEDGISIRYLNSSQIYLHPMYNIWLKRYDIALVRLDPPLQYSRKVAPLCLPNITKLSVQPGELCYVTGWGSTNGIGPPNTSLKQLLVRVLNNDVCKYKYFYSATYMILCVGGEHKRDTCAGDSGGGLMCQSSTNGRWELQGLVSFGASTCGQSGFPTIYMQVPFFLPWIQSVMREQCTLWRNS
uniref:Peptidase S1 domain-containing protein n=1 Tax=Ciona savignyi TaxID=51511 RepID=H2Z616_CIOSA